MCDLCTDLAHVLSGYGGDLILGRADLSNLITMDLRRFKPSGLTRNRFITKCLPSQLNLIILGQIWLALHAALLATTTSNSLLD